MGITGGVAKHDMTGKLYEMEQRVHELEEALQTLMDLQNGAPLIRFEREWEAAMDKARKLLRD